MNPVAPSSSGSPVIRWLRKGLPTLLVLLMLAAGWLTIHELAGHTDAPEVVQEGVNHFTEGEVTLSEGKLRAANLEILPTEVRLVQNTHTVPGRLGYDETQHIEVKAPLDGVLEQILVLPGQTVREGQLLAVMQCTEIGHARAEVVRIRKEREIAAQVAERNAALHKNLEQLAAMLETKVQLPEIEAAFADRQLGRYRGEILSAYTEMRLAQELLAKVENLTTPGAIPGRTIRERQAEAQIAQAAYRTAVDEALFSARQSQLGSAAKLGDIDRQLSLAWQAVDALLGFAQQRSIDSTWNEESLARLEIRAQFAGTVESIMFASRERVPKGVALVVLANTASLYVSASIRESDWSAISLERGTKIKVQVPAIEGRVFDAEVRYFGREVQAETNSIPLVAVITNQEGLLRPGMFVRVTIPVDEAREALSVTPAAIMQHENQQFVFVELPGGTFQRVDVSTGRATKDWVEIASGLQPGQRVVARGAFLLKSELLLQGEAE